MLVRPVVILPASPQDRFGGGKRGTLVRYTSDMQLLTIVCLRPQRIFMEAPASMGKCCDLTVCHSELGDILLIGGCEDRRATKTPACNKAIESAYSTCGRF